MFARVIIVSHVCGELIWSGTLTKFVSICLINNKGGDNEGLGLIALT